MSSLPSGSRPALGNSSRWDWKASACSTARRCSTQLRHSAGTSIAIGCSASGSVRDAASSRQSRATRSRRICIQLGGRDVLLRASAKASPNSSVEAYRPNCAPVITAGPFSHVVRCKPPRSDHCTLLRAAAIPATRALRRSRISKKCRRARRAFLLIPLGDRLGILRKALRQKPKHFCRGGVDQPERVGMNNDPGEEKGHARARSQHPSIEAYRQ